MQGKGVFLELKLFNLLLSSGNDVNARNDNDHTCLHAAACSGWVTL